MRPFRFLATTLLTTLLAGAAPAQSFSGCGTLVQGVTCVLFQPETGGLYLLATNGGFGVGAHVYVTGLLDPSCFTLCQQGNGCIDQNTIQPCAPGTPFCIPPVSAMACPCSNDGANGAGCANSQTGSAGALLTSSGSTAPDSVVLTAQGMLPTALCVFLQGDAQVSGGAVFGDGVRCTGGQLLRLAVRNASGGTASYPDFAGGDPSITARCVALGAPIPPNSDRYYQTYYRDPSPSFCSAPQGDTFNISNGQIVHWP
jgi:hypothetical protein